jgi:hypothetical protein
MDVDEEILEFFEENDWDMSIESIEFCANKMRAKFGSEEEAAEYIQSYLNSLFGN